MPALLVGARVRLPDEDIRHLGVPSHGGEVERGAALGARLLHIGLRSCSKCYHHHGFYKETTGNPIVAKNKKLIPHSWEVLEQL